MVMRLAIALDVPLRQHNALLIAAGFAPVWRHTNLAAPELGEIFHFRPHFGWVGHIEAP